MKTFLAKTFSMVTILTTIMILSSCHSETDEIQSRNEQYDESYITKVYTSLYRELAYKVFEEYRTDCNIISDIDSGQNKKLLSEKYAKILPQDDLNYLEQKLPIKIKEGTVVATKVPNDFINKIKPIMFDPDTTLLSKNYKEFYNESLYKSLPQQEQLEIKLQLHSLKIIRDAIINLISEETMLRNRESRSPGDRMVMSEAASQMSDEQLSNIIDAGLSGISIVAGKAISAAISIATAIKNFIN